MIFRDFTPNNELKYLSIAQEAIENGNIFAFYNHEIIYTDKPPLYIWIVMLCYLIFGHHSMLALGLFSLIPAFVIIWIMNKWVGKNISPIGKISAELSLMTMLYFAGSGLVLRMDMLMSMFIILALYTFWKMYNGDNSLKNRILFPIYIFMGLFTKGPVGLILPICAVPIFLIIKRDIKSIGKYLGWLSWGIIAALCAVWFAGAYIDGGSAYLNDLLFHQTIDRAVDAFHHKEPFYFYCWSIWYAIFPWSFLMIITLIIAGCKKLINSDLEKYFTIIIVSFFIIMSIFSSKLVIYLLPIFPFIAYLTFMVLPKLKSVQFAKWMVAIPAAVFALALPAYFIAGEIIEIPLSEEIPYWIAAIFLSAGGVISIILLFKDQIYKAINSIAISMLITLFLAGFFVSKFNPIIGFENICKEGKEYANELNINNFGYYKLRSGENMDSYLKVPLKSLSEDDLRSESQGPTLVFIKNSQLEKDTLLNKTFYKSDHNEGLVYSYFVKE